MPRSLCLLPISELTQRCAARPYLRMNFAHPVWGLAVTLYQRLSYRQPDARGQIVLAQVEIDVELVTGERPALGRPCHHL